MLNQSLVWRSSTMVFRAYTMNLMQLRGISFLILNFIVSCLRPPCLKLSCDFLCISGAKTEQSQLLLKISSMLIRLHLDKIQVIIKLVKWQDTFTQFPTICLINVWNSNFEWIFILYLSCIFLLKKDLSLFP